MRTEATYRLVGGGSARAVTEMLGLEPTIAAEVGDRRGRSTVSVPYWFLSSGLPTDAELADHLDWLLDRLEPRQAELWRLVEAGYTADWFCLAASHATEHAVELDRALLARLLAVPGDLLIDVTGDD
ncbi:DUF4279 domain-containing protein [Actinokineospora enzanensis]|uniref:DUF4279 domain-containing protein n=1 Tax=Actinokineospora enzanensis TaxID=155975 RepID=UPI0003811E82|nr:DUF4279 domain-containing protein [Actinokineospora enzanensis]